MLGDHSGGNESYYTNILRAMKVDQEDKVYLFCKEDIDVSEFEGKFTVVRFKNHSSFKRNFVELNQLCKQYDIDVLHTQYFIPFIRSCKVVCTIHDICFEHYKNIFTKKEYCRRKLLIPYAAKHSEYIFTVSNHAKSDIVEHYNVDPDNVIVTYNAVNEQFKMLSDEELKEAELREKFQIGEQPFVLTVGNLQPRKNLPRLIAAFNAWKAEYQKPVKLIVVGKKAWMYSDILKAVGADNGNIVLTDYVTNDDLVRLYNAAACFFYPSFFEGFGIPPLEAMSCGTPVAVADATSLPEVVGDAGIYFNPFDTDEIKRCLQSLMSDEDLQNNLRSKGLSRRNQFSWEKSAKKIYSTYHRCK